MSPSEWIALAALLFTIFLALAAHMKSQGAQTAILKEVQSRIQKQSDKISANTKGIAQLNVLVEQLRDVVKELTESNGRN